MLYGVDSLKKEGYVTVEQYDLFYDSLTLWHITNTPTYYATDDTTKKTTVLNAKTVKRYPNDLELKRLINGKIGRASCRERV